MTDHPIAPILTHIRAAQAEAARTRLLALRKDLGITQREFAERIGKSLDWVKSIEGGRTPADLALVEAAEILLRPTIPAVTNPIRS